MTTIYFWHLSDLSLSCNLSLKTSWNIMELKHDQNCKVVPGNMHYLTKKARKKDIGISIFMAGLGPVLNLMTPSSWQSLALLTCLFDVWKKLCWSLNPVCFTRCSSWQCGKPSGITGDAASAAQSCSGLGIVMGRSHQGTPRVCVYWGETDSGGRESKEIQTSEQ